LKVFYLLDRQRLRRCEKMVAASLERLDKNADSSGGSGVFLKKRFSFSTARRIGSLFTPRTPSQKYPLAMQNWQKHLPLGAIPSYPLN